MKPKFEPDVPGGANQGLSPTLIDPEAYDATEQTFAASLEQTTSTAPRKFVVEEKVSEVAASTPSENALGRVEEPARETQHVASTASSQAESRQSSDPDSWRREIAARLHHYRARRRPREARYPSLQLKFETEQVSHASTRIAQPIATAAPRQTVDHVLSATVPRIQLDEPSEYTYAALSKASEPIAKVIEFASYTPPPRPVDELAEPVLDRPRIIEAPELVPPPPALGGISIEPAEEPANERRPGFEIPLQPAPMARRMIAAGIDAALVMSAIAGFVYVSFRITNVLPPPGKVVSTAAFLIAILWSAYQYLFLVYTGETPGLRLSRLVLHRFDGNPVPRNIRRWRVLASLLSGLSLGLGYAWCLLDEDQLCWHDRITRTYMAPRK